jgi:hypothetical protein
VTLAYGMGYAVAGWVACGVAGASYTAWLLVRGRRAASRVPDGRRRWSDPS